MFTLVTPAPCLSAPDARPRQAAPFHYARRVPGCETGRMDAGREPLERAYREDATRIRAALAARTGDVGLAEDAVQDAFVEAIEHWARDGIPANPGGWLAPPPRRKALDRLRRDKVGADKMALLAATEGWATPSGGTADGA